jgi:integrase
VKTKAIQTAIAAFRSAGVADDRIEAALRGLGFDTAVVRERAAGATRKAAKTASTETKVRAAEPGVYRVMGARRLYLKKTARDRGSYFLRYRANGERHDMGLGSIYDVSLADARTRAEELSVKLSKKTDLIAERELERAATREKAEEEAREAATPTVEAAVMAYVEANAPSWRHHYARTNWLNPIKTYALPLIGHLKVDAVQSRDILTVVKAMDDKGVSVLAGKVRSHLRTMFDYFAAHGLRDAALSNPADARVISAGRPKAETATEHYRRIDIDSAPGVFARLVTLASSNVAIACWVFMILTAARPGEAIAVRWDQIDVAKKLWLNPAPKTKKMKKAKAGAKAETDKPLPVPLSPLALAIVEERAKARTSDLVFPGRGGAKLVHTTFALAPRQAGVDAAAPHSWRSVFRDVVEDKLGFRRETVEAGLGHSLGATEEAYRRETGLPARVPMMAGYADWLMSKGADADNVVALPART